MKATEYFEEGEIYSNKALEDLFLVYVVTDTKTGAKLSGIWVDKSAKELMKPAILNIIKSKFKDWQLVKKL